MSKWPFVVWMLGFPVASSTCSLLNRLGSPQRIYSEQVESASAFIMIVIWAGIGWLLWNRNPKEK